MHVVLFNFTRALRKILIDHRHSLARLLPVKTWSHSGNEMSWEHVSKDGRILFLVIVLFIKVLSITTEKEAGDFKAHLLIAQWRLFWDLKKTFSWQSFRFICKAENGSANWWFHHNVVIFWKTMYDVREGWGKPFLWSSLHDLKRRNHPFHQKTFPHSAGHICCVLRCHWYLRSIRYLTYEQ